MKMLVMMIISATAFAQTGIEALGTDTLNDAKPKANTLSTVDKVELKVAEGVKIKCEAKLGCAFFVDEGKGFDVKLNISFGEGPNYATGGSGINIYGSSSGGHFGSIAITATYANYRCTRFVPESSFILAESYQRLMASNEYMERVFAAWKKGEDMPTMDAIKTALSVLATVKPSQTNCGQRITN